MKQVKSDLGELLHGGAETWLRKPPGAAKRLLESCVIGLDEFRLKYSGSLHYRTQLRAQVLFFSPYSVTHPTGSEGWTRGFAPGYPSKL